MLGLSVLFFLGIWIIITIVAMVIGSKFGRKPATSFFRVYANNGGTHYSLDN